MKVSSEIKFRYVHGKINDQETLLNFGLMSFQRIKIIHY